MEFCDKPEKCLLKVCSMNYKGFAKHCTKWARFVLHRSTSWFRVSVSIPFTLNLRLLLLRCRRGFSRIVGFLQILTTKKENYIVCLLCGWVARRLNKNLSLVFVQYLLRIFTLYFATHFSCSRRSLLLIYACSLVSVTAFNYFSLVHSSRAAAPLKKLQWKLVNLYLASTKGPETEWLNLWTVILTKLKKKKKISVLLHVLCVLLCVLFS